VRNFSNLLNGKRSKVLSRAEVLGCLCFNGFEIIHEGYAAGLFCFAAQKKTSPDLNGSTSYGPVITLPRIGKGGKTIKVYKMRTMHAYSEYLQEYVYRLNDLQQNGKINKDFRITTAGRFMRRVWLDELPMVFNLLRGDLKLVGVRPLSKQYFSLYDKKLRNKRIRHKPGLVPPYYADLPNSFNEIMKSEKGYLSSYEKNPVRTDIVYFFKAVYNIIFKKIRSN